VDDAVRAEASAVTTLRSGVERFAAHVAEALDESRSQLRAAHDKAQRAVEQRRNRLERTSRALTQAKAALAQCPPEARAAAAQAVAQALGANERAKSSLERARRAAATIDRAGGELLKSLSSARTQIDIHAAAGMTYLTTLEGQLKAITSSGSVAGALLGTAAMIAKAAATSEVALEIALSGVEKVAHLPDGIFHETGGPIHEIIDAVRSTRLGEGGAVAELDRHEATEKPE
jgi:chromosome segregation ATPase